MDDELNERRETRQIVHLSLWMLDIDNLERSSAQDKRPWLSVLALPLVASMTPVIKLPTAKAP